MVETEQPFDDLPIDTANLSVRDLSAILAQPNPVADREVPGPVIHDEKVGEIQPRQPVETEPAAVQEPTPAPVEEAHKEADIEEQERKAPRFRLRPRSDEEEAVFKGMAQAENASLTYEQVKAKLFPPAVQQHQQAAEETPAQTPTPAPLDELEARIAELAAKKEEADLNAAEAKANYNFEDEAKFNKEAAALDKEWREKIHALTKSLAKSAPEAKAPEQVPQISEAETAAFEAEVAEDHASVFAAYPGLDLGESGPLKHMHEEMVRLKAEWIAKNNPVVDSPQLASALAFAAAAKLNIRPGAEPTRVTAPVPGPAGAAPRMAAPVPKPVPFDAEAYAAGLNPFTLKSAFAR